MNSEDARSKDLTHAEQLLLGLIAEMPRHAYQLNKEIELRGMREWTPIGFSSIYFVLGQLEKMGLISAKKPTGAKARKTFRVTTAGRQALVAQTLDALSTYQPTYSSVLLGMIHWPILQREEALEALRARGETVESFLRRGDHRGLHSRPLPFPTRPPSDLSIGQLEAEVEWIERTLDYMKTKPWLE